jgi:hypothetical protein
MKSRTIWEQQVPSSQYLIHLKMAREAETGNGI